MHQEFQVSLGFHPYLLSQVVFGTSGVWRRRGQPPLRIQPLWLGFDSLTLLEGKAVGGV